MAKGRGGEGRELGATWVAVMKERMPYRKKFQSVKEVISGAKESILLLWTGKRKKKGNHEIEKRGEKSNELARGG